MARPTIRDISRLTGLSTYTISQALRGAEGVSDESRARVLAAANDIGYIPNRAAQDLPAAFAGIELQVRLVDVRRKVSNGGGLGRDGRFLSVNRTASSEERDGREDRNQNRRNRDSFTHTRLTRERVRLGNEYFGTCSSRCRQARTAARPRTADASSRRGRIVA